MHKKSQPVDSPTNQSTKFLDQTIDMNQQLPQNPHHVFILVNSNSGSQYGREMIKKCRREIVVKCGQGGKDSTRFYVYDMSEYKQIGGYFEVIKNTYKTQQVKSVKILIAGGDGTIQWALTQSINHQLDFQRVTFGTLAIGTGNDFAKSIGWDLYKFEFSRKKLEQLAVVLLKCETGYYDVWQCKIQCAEDSGIMEIKNGVEKDVGKVLVRNFTNYFGIGGDAKISYIAQKMNAKTIFFKKLSYAAAFFCSLVNPVKSFNKVLKRFLHSKQISSRLDTQKQLQLQRKIFSEKALKNQTDHMTQIEYHDSDSCITFLNSTVSMQLQKIWQTPYSVNEDKKFQMQTVDDGNIEVVSYKNEKSIALQRFCHNAKKVQQGPGPFLLEFKKNQSNQNQITYIHVNGEPYKLTNVQKIEISKNSSIHDSRIKVLKYKQ